MPCTTNRSPSWLQSHQQEIHDALTPLHALTHRGYGYEGPWLEHRWIEEVTRRGYKGFGRWVLLLVPWLSIQAYPDVKRNVTQLLTAKLQPHVCYAAVFTDDCSFARAASAALSAAARIVLALRRSLFFVTPLTRLTGLRDGIARGPCGF